MTRRQVWLIVAVVVGVGSTLAIARSAPKVNADAVSGTGGAGTASGPALVAGPGRVEAVSEEIAVAAELSGKLAELLIEEGDLVTKGQPLARLEQRDYVARRDSARARLAVAEAERARLVNGARPEERREAAAVASQAEASLDHARLEVERSRRLFAEGVIARDVLDRVERDWRVATARQAETSERAQFVAAAARVDELARADAAVMLARAMVDEADALLAKTVVRAPIDGVILRRHRRAGESVSLESPSPAIVTMADTRILRVRVDVDESDVARLVVGTPAWVVADAYGDRKFTGHVVRIGGMLGRKNLRTDEPSERVDTKILETLIELDAGARLPIGLRVDAFIGAVPSR
jgi:ABC exporter DevB family membrane fusion protein